MYALAHHVIQLQDLFYRIQQHVVFALIISHTAKHVHLKVHALHVMPRLELFWTSLHNVQFAQTTC